MRQFYFSCKQVQWVKHDYSLLSDFINLTQVHNFTVSAHVIFTFRRLSVFTVSFTRILQEVMQKMKHFSTILLSSQVVLVQSLQPKGPEFESTQDLVFFFFLYFYLFIRFV